MASPSKLRQALWLSAVLLATAAQAQTKIGYVDWRRVLENAPQISVARQNLDAEFRQRNAALNERQTELSALEQRLTTEGPLMSSEQLQDLERQVRNQRRNLAADRDELADELEFRLSEERQRVEQSIFNVVRDFAAANGYDLIMPGPVLYAGDSIDLTTKILEQLRAESDRQVSTP